MVIAASHKHASTKLRRCRQPGVTTTERGPLGSGAAAAGALRTPTQAAGWSGVAASSAARIAASFTVLGSLPSPPVSSTASDRLIAAPSRRAAATPSGGPALAPESAAPRASVAGPPLVPPPPTLFWGLSPPLFLGGPSL